MRVRAAQASMGTAPDTDTATDPARVPVAEALARMAHETRLLSQEAADLDAGISKLLLQSTIAEQHGLHAADMLRQGLEGLEQFITLLADTIGPDGCCAPGHAARHLGLQAQAMRLRGDDTGPTHDTAPELWDG